MFPYFVVSTLPPFFGFYSTDWAAVDQFLIHSPVVPELRLHLNALLFAFFQLSVLSPEVLDLVIALPEECANRQELELGGSPDIVHLLRDVSDHVEDVILDVHATSPVRLSVR